MRRFVPLLASLLCLPSFLIAEGPAFDLAGPKVDVHVKRGEITLPISQAANLLPGDRLWIHPDLPPTQSTHFVLVVAFLRGATNPPPNDWYTRVETWLPNVRSEGVFVTVPQEAQQALLFLAPETGGDFSTLRKAVHDRPGSFVRATQDLQQASWDRMRLDAYLTAVKITSQVDQKALKERTELSARSLGIRVDQQCFDKPTDQQAPCLVQLSDGMVLDDANAQSLVTQLANGSTGDLMNQLSYSTMGGGGMYSPYVGAIVDTAKILASLHTAHFQYIPALALPTKDTLNLRLNLPPSFRDPKSVVVVALPPIGPAKLPSLRASNPTEIQCAQKPELALGTEGAPLVFATALARDLHLHIEAQKGPIDIPVLTDPARGGFVPAGSLPALPPGELVGVVRGKWGFDDWEGPRFRILSAGPTHWTVASDDETALVIGRDDTLHVQGDSTLCVSKIELAGAKPLPLTWKSPKPDLLAIEMPMKEAKPGPLAIQIHQYGIAKPDELALNAYSEAASLEHLTLSAGDTSATLKGTRLDEVAKAGFNGIEWTPAALSRVQDLDQLVLNTTSSTGKLEPAVRYTARVWLHDGRQINVPMTVQPPRPQVALLNKGTQDDGTPGPIHLASADDLPISAKLVFFLKTIVPQKFPRNEDVEVAAEDGSFRTILSVADGTLMLEDQKTALGVVEPLTKFGSSAFGPLRARAISADGVAGDWMPLGTLVRLPVLKDLHCPHATAKPCTLTGTNLFLLDSVASTQDFDNPSQVPADFTGAQLSVPHPVNGNLYIKLRDDSQTVQTLTMPVTPTAPTGAQAAAASPNGTTTANAPTQAQTIQAPAPAATQSTQQPSSAEPATQPQATEPAPPAKPQP